MSIPHLIPLPMSDARTWLGTRTPDRCYPAYAPLKEEDIHFHPSKIEIGERDWKGTEEEVSGSVLLRQPTSTV